MIVNEKHIYRSASFPLKAKAFTIIQEHAASAYLFFFAIWACGLYLIIANHLAVFWYGIIGLLSIFLLSNAAGMIRSKMQYVEIGFNGAFFYLANVYDVAFKEEISYYPSAFSNVNLIANEMHINYKGQIIILKKEDWKDWAEMYQSFFYQAVENETKNEN